MKSEEITKIILKNTVASTNQHSGLWTVEQALAFRTNTNLTVGELRRALAEAKDYEADPRLVRPGY